MSHVVQEFVRDANKSGRIVDVCRTPRSTFPTRAVSEGMASGDLDDLARDPSGGIADEECDRRGNIFRCSQAA